MPKEGQQADNVRAFVEEYEKDKLLTPKPKRKVIGKERFNYNLRIKNLPKLKEKLLDLSRALDEIYDTI